MSHKCCVLEAHLQFSFQYVTVVGSRWKANVIFTESISFFQTDYSEDCADTKPDRDIELELSALDTDEPDGQGEQIEVSSKTCV